MAAIPRMYSRL